MTVDPLFWRGRRVLVTGHTGFKGCWLTLCLLTLQADVWGYALAPDSDSALFTALGLNLDASNSSRAHVHHRLGDVRHFEALQQSVIEAQPEVVFHLAAQPLVRRSYRDPLGTWATNVQGSLHLLEALKSLHHSCAVVMVTTDKVYSNREWVYGYRENDRLGGHDPYSASKAAMELAISSWRSSFCGVDAFQTPYLSIASARAGNVIGGGDWSEDRIVPDVMRALASGQTVPVRNPRATRPWQHVLEALSGYLLLAERLAAGYGPNNPYADSFNFGPTLEANRSVGELVDEVLLHWSGSWSDLSDPNALHEAHRLHLHVDKAHRLLGWQPKWDFATTVSRTVNWYRSVHEGASPLACCLADIEAYKI